MKILNDTTFWYLFIFLRVIIVLLINYDLTPLAQVSWVRRKNDEEAMELLTTGTQQYTTDDR
jgi:hypothetical protein